MSLNSREDQCTCTYMYADAGVILTLLLLESLCSINRFDQVFLLMLDQVQPLCQSEQKFCNSFFHFPRDEDDSQVSVKRMKNK